MEREVFCECFMRTVEEVVVGYWVDINSSVFGDRLLKHSLRAQMVMVFVLSRVRETVDERSCVKSRNVLFASLLIWAEWLVHFCLYFGVRGLVSQPRYLVS
jgi:hypothetical protein